MRGFFTILVFLFYSCAATSQIKEPDYVLENPRDYTKFPARNANYIELLGNGGLYSINFERIFLYKEKFKVSGRVGANVNFVGAQIEQGYLIENSYVFLRNPHHIEIGPGLTLQRKYNPGCTDTTTYQWESIWYGMFRIGYRFQKQDDGFFLKAGILPIFYTKNSCYSEFPPKNWFWGGVAVGLSF